MGNALVVLARTPEARAASINKHFDEEEPTLRSLRRRSLRSERVLAETSQRIRDERRCAPPIAAIWHVYLVERALTLFHQMCPVDHIVWAILYGRWPVKQIDHEDRNRANNRPHNLKEATGREQNLNRRVSNKTGYKGVCANQSGNFQARLWVGETQYNLGTFPIAREAALAFDSFAVTIPGVLTNKQLGML